MKKEINKSYGKIMILVPHEDDEVIIAGGIIQSACLCNLPVTVVIATNGDYKATDKSVGLARLQESIQALDVIAAGKISFIPMGYPDTGYLYEDSFLMNLYHEQDSSRILSTSFTDYSYGLKDYPEYHRRKYGVPALCTRASFVSDLQDILEEVSPDTIFTTSPNDRHGDHAALAFFLRDILGKQKKESGKCPTVYCSIIHSCDGYGNWPNKGPRFSRLEKLEAVSEWKWENRISFPVNCVSQKRLAMEKYKTQLTPEMTDILMSYVKEEEIFWQLDI